MKVLPSIRALYEAQREVASRVEDKVKPLLSGGKKEAWHYTGRIKGEVSFAQKLETGRAGNGQMDDLFACTLVVANQREVDIAEKMVRGLFELVSRKPNTPSETSNRASDFAFDDLRLYFRLKESQALGDQAMGSFIFEVQVKTFLAHAWSIATHDLVYKTDDVTWGKERVSHQVRAMLQNAEASLDVLEQMAQSSMLSRSDVRTVRVKEAIGLLQQLWPADRLPVDVKRLAEAVDDLLWASRVELGTLRGHLEAESQAGQGAKKLDLPPFYVIASVLGARESEKMKTMLKNRHGKFKLTWPAKELALPEGWTPAELPNLVLIGGT